MTNRLRILLISCFATLIIGCGSGTSGANGDDPFGDGDTATSFTIALTLSKDGENVSQFLSGDSILVQAQLTDDEGQAINDVIVQFSAGSGSVSPASALTSAGIATTQLTTTATDVGAATITVEATIDGVTVTQSRNYEVRLNDNVSGNDIRFGHFDSNNQFIDDQLGTGSDEQNVTISAGATLGLYVALVDENEQPISTPVDVTFTSQCVSNGLASIDANVTTINGRASSTYRDISCAGNSGNIDVITASIVVNSSQITLSRTIELLPEAIGSIAFISAEPQNIVLQGTGGQNNSSVSTLTFQVNGALGNPLAQQQVNFALNTTAGGLSLAPESGLTNAAGQVTTQVTAGTVPTSVRVTASVDGDNGEVISTQSDLLSVNTGLPDQDSFSLSASVLNPEANRFDGVEVTLTARLSDTFNNPIPDGTQVEFTTEGGQIDGSCLTSNGACSVSWRSQAPRADNHRITVLAYAIGQETLFDSNGNNVFDDSDGEAVNDSERTSSGFGSLNLGETGFGDMSEAWVDYDEDRSYDSFERFIDFNNNGIFDGKNALFEGANCQSNTLCGENSLHVRKALVLVMSDGDAQLDILNNSGTLWFSNYRSVSNQPSLGIPRGSSLGFQLQYSDSAGEILPAGTSIAVTTSAGELLGTTSITVPNDNRRGKSTESFSLSNNLNAADNATTATVTITSTAPSGFISDLTFSVSLL